MSGQRARPGALAAPGRGPPRRDAVRNYQRILDAAREVLGESGADASMEQIAARAGVGVGTVYRRFASKDALIDELLRLALEELTGGRRPGAGPHRRARARGAAARVRAVVRRPRPLREPVPRAPGRRRRHAPDPGGHRRAHRARRGGRHGAARTSPPATSWRWSWACAAWPRPPARLAPAGLAAVPRHPPGRPAGAAAAGRARRHSVAGSCSIAVRAPEAIPGQPLRCRHPGRMECHMAQRAEIVFTDDIDGSEAAGTVRFGLQGTSYEIDLSQKNADQLAKVLEPYVTGRRGRSASRGGRRPARARPGRARRPSGNGPGPRAWRSRTRAGCPPSSS